MEYKGPHLITSHDFDRSQQDQVRSAGRAALAVVLLMLAAVGCASKPTPTTARVPPADIKIYQTPDLLQSQYTLVEHVWTDSWRTNITFPSFTSEADGIDAMKRVASEAGANGLINVICLDARAANAAAAEFNCYGDAIRVN